MKRYLVHLLVALNFALVCLLGGMWITPHRELRQVHWQAPKPLKLDVDSLLPSRPREGQVDISQFLGTLERPLFSPTRRPPLPPPPPVVPPPPPPPDPLANIHLYGVVAGSDTGGIIARIEGKTKRVQLGETVGPWTLKSIADRNVTFVRDNEAKVLPLVHARSNAASGLPSTSPVSVPVSPSLNPAPSTSVANPAPQPLSTATPPPSSRPMFSIGGMATPPTKPIP